MAETESAAARRLQDEFALAAERFEAGDYAGAKDLLEALLHKVPDHPEILNYLAVTEHLCGDIARAQGHLTQALNVMPDYFDAWNNLGLLCIEQGHADAAIHAFQQACRLAPDAADPTISLAHALHAADRFDAAVEAYRSGLALQPDHPVAWAALCRALLVEGRWDEAAAAADRQLAVRPGHTVAMALKSVALQELGDDQALRDLVDFDQLIECFEIEVPAGYDDLAAFNRALVDFCQQHPSLAYAPSDKATEFGYQTDNLASETDSPIADLLAVVGKCAGRYRRARPLSPDHPFLAQQPDRWHYDIWATVLESGGHQQSHIHRAGWLSGVYYAQKPAVIDAQPSAADTSDADRAGWIEFGRPVPYPKARAEPVTRCFPPVEGHLYLFPSYFYHRTIPFFAETPRISIAVDLRDRVITRQVPFFDYVEG